MRSDALAVAFVAGYAAFQSTLLHEERLYKVVEIHGGYIFQSTLLHEERQNLSTE